MSFLATFVATLKRHAKSLKIMTKFNHNLAHYHIKLKEKKLQMPPLFFGLKIINIYSQICSRFNYKRQLPWQHTLLPLHNNQHRVTLVWIIAFHH